MLDELHVHDIALIEEAQLEFPEGLTVLTGETGAGKTALLAALKLICGARADMGFVRDGAEEARAEARIFDGEEHVVKRRLTSSGRSRCSIDGQMASVGELASIASTIEIHGQHEQVALLEPSRQLAYLDVWAHDEKELDEYRRWRHVYFDALEEYELLSSAHESNSAELELMRFAKEQIEAVSPQRGEYEELEELLPRLQNADELDHALQEAIAVLNEDGAALDLIARAGSALHSHQGIDKKLDAIAETLEGIKIDLSEVAHDLSSYAQDIDTDPYMLERTLSRLDELSGLMHRFGPTMAEVFTTLEKAQAALDAAELSPEKILAAKEKMEEAKAHYEKAAQALSAKRHEAAPRFCEKLSAEVAELAMEGVSFEFSFSELDFDRWGSAGSETAELLFSSSGASKPRPLRKIASGGELSRILLGLECVHYEAGENQKRACTIVFDEVDSGIGGATAQAVAKKLDLLARSAQVIVVTHLAQVAALADAHYVVEKQNVEDAMPITTVCRVEGDDRVAEIARMLSGDTEEVAREHARVLLEGTEPAE